MGEEISRLAPSVPALLFLLYIFFRQFVFLALDCLWLTGRKSSNGVFGQHERDFGRFLLLLHLIHPVWFDLLISNNI
jgi:hypothetical protein